MRPIVFMLYQAIAGDTSPPDLTIEADAAVPGGSGYLVPIRVANRGGSAAARVVVEGTLHDGAAIVETSVITVDYVPSGSHKNAGLIFSRDPRKLTVRIRAKGYERP